MSAQEDHRLVGPDGDDGTEDMDVPPLEAYEPVVSLETSAPTERLSAIEEESQSQETSNDPEMTMEYIINRCFQTIKDVMECIRRRWTSTFPKDDCLFLVEACLETLHSGEFSCDPIFRQIVEEVIPKILQKYFTSDALTPPTRELDSMIMFCFKTLEIVVLALPYSRTKVLDIMTKLFSTDGFFCTSLGKEYLVPNEEAAIDPTMADKLFITLVNMFNQNNGFDIWLGQFEAEEMSLLMIYENLRPFKNLISLLRITIIEKYFLSLLKKIPTYIENLTGENLIKEFKTTFSCDNLLVIITILKAIHSRLTNFDSEAMLVAHYKLEYMYLSVLLKLLNTPLYNNKICALNELNRLIGYFVNRMETNSCATISYNLNNRREWADLNKLKLKSADLAKWCIDHDLLDVIFKDCLHQLQYVDKLKYIFSFLLREKFFSSTQFDKIWNSQSGKHEVITQNIHQLIIHLAWNFSAEQWDYFFKSFHTSWESGTKKEREKLLELARCLSDNDKIAGTILDILWALTFDAKSNLDIIYPTLATHLKILESCSPINDNTKKFYWLTKFVNRLRESNCDQWTLPVMKQIREICLLFAETNDDSIIRTANNSFANNFSLLDVNAKYRSIIIHRHELIVKLEDQYCTVMLIFKSLAAYMSNLRESLAGHTFPIDSTFFEDDDGARLQQHINEVEERLNFLRFLLQNGHMWLSLKQANELWSCLLVNAVFDVDRDICFRFFSSLIKLDDSDIEPEFTLQFFSTNVLQLDPSLINVDGVVCFEKYFKMANTVDSKILLDNSGEYFMDNENPTGLEYLWKLILLAPEATSLKAIELLLELYTHLGPALIKFEYDISLSLIECCFDKLQTIYETMANISLDTSANIKPEEMKMMRILDLLQKYINQSDFSYQHERRLLPMSRAFLGRKQVLWIKIKNPTVKVEQIKVPSHYNETLESLKNQILVMVRMFAPLEVEFYDQRGKKVDTKVNRYVSDLVKDESEANFVARILSGPTKVINSNDSLEKRNKQESLLPGVIISRHSNYVDFIIKLLDLSIKLNSSQLTTMCYTLLQSIPADPTKVDLVRKTCERMLTQADTSMLTQVLLSTPTKTVYYLDILFSLLLPPKIDMLAGSQEFQCLFFQSKCCFAIIDRLLDIDKFLPDANCFYKICATSIIMKLSKFVFATIAFLKVYSMNFNQNYSDTLRTMASEEKDVEYAKKACDKLLLLKNLSEEPDSLSFLLAYTPPLELFESIISIILSSSTNDADFLLSVRETIIMFFTQTDTIAANMAHLIVQIGCDGLGSLSLLYFPKLELMDKHLIDEKGIAFVSTLLSCKNITLRRATKRNLFFIFSLRQDASVFNVFIGKLFSLIAGNSSQGYSRSREFFELVSELLGHALKNNIEIQDLKVYLLNELTVLINPHEHLLNSDGQIDNTLLEGQLRVCKSLVDFIDCSLRLTIGQTNSNYQLINLLVNKYLFTPTELMISGQPLTPGAQIDPICNTSDTLKAGYDLLAALATGCLSNFSMIAGVLGKYLSKFDLKGYNHSHQINIRRPGVFVGLKNAGGTCYMNSVLQQLFMIPGLRKAILSVPITQLEDANFLANTDEEKKYKLNIVKEVQIIFANLLHNKCQFFIPDGFWHTFRFMEGVEINLREQHDAVEFFNNLVDTLDEGMKLLDQPPVTNHLGGLFSDQKICQGCPHRYWREESFNTLSIDIHNNNSLLDSLEQYVKGDLLEEDNAYYCEKCDRKVDTIKRMCIKKLPKVLTIQLKRFGYDFDQGFVNKFYDYFEFPRNLDMKPYTEKGLAELEGEVIGGGSPVNGEAERDDCTQYELSGIIVHSGQANGGHYYSYVLQESLDGSKKWFKIDDCDVSEFDLENDEQLKANCFGGDYCSDFFDFRLRTMSRKTNQRWWSAYILIYRKINIVPSVNSLENFKSITIPPSVQLNIQNWNLNFMHRNTFFSHEFFDFIRQLINSNIGHLDSNNNLKIPEEDFSKIVSANLHFISRFLFIIGFRVNNDLRGPAMRWFELIVPYLMHNKVSRLMFFQRCIIDNDQIFWQFLIECPSHDIRSVFCKLLCCLSQLVLLDEQHLDANGALYPQCLLQQLIRKLFFLLNNSHNSSDSINFDQYFNFFLEMADQGKEARKFLLSSNIPLSFVMMFNGDYRLSRVNFGYADVLLMCQVLALLLRCVDLSTCQKPLVVTQEAARSNPFKYEDDDEYMGALSPELAILVFEQTNFHFSLITNFICKETVLLFQYLCWGNEKFSTCSIGALLWNLTYNVSQTFDAKPFLEFLYKILAIEDQLQEARFEIAFQGGKKCYENKTDSGIFDLIQPNNQNDKKRAYSCFKFLVSLLTNFEKAVVVFKRTRDYKKKWLQALNHFRDCHQHSEESMDVDNSPTPASNESNSEPSHGHACCATFSKIEQMLSEEEAQDLENDSPESPSSNFDSGATEMDVLNVPLY